VTFFAGDFLVLAGLAVVVVFFAVAVLAVLLSAATFLVAGLAVVKVAFFVVEVLGVAVAMIFTPFVDTVRNYFK
jgi:hypothetical protein